MSNDPSQGDESTSPADPSRPAEPEATDLDLRTEAPESTPLASLAFRLFSTIENQIARDPNAAALTGLASRLDVLERGVASSVSRADVLKDMSERLDEIDGHLAAPDPHATSLTSLNDRLAAVEHRLAAPHPHTATITSLAERLDEAEAKGTPRNISDLTERLEIVESHASASEDLTRLTDRVTSIERRLPAPGVIAGLQQQFQDVAMRFALLEKPAEERSETRRWPLYVLAVLAVAAIAALVVMAAI